MNGMMVRNDITISLISCQFETSTVLILERLFIFAIETTLNLKREHYLFYNIPSFRVLLGLINIILLVSF